MGKVDELAPLVVNLYEVFAEVKNERRTKLLKRLVFTYLLLVDGKSEAIKRSLILR